MKLTFLGTNGWYSTEAGYTICTLLETENFYIIFDAGEGFWKLNKYITKEKPVYLFFSHVHLDHAYGLHLIPRTTFRERLSIVIPQSKLKFLKLLADSPYMGSLAKMGIDIIVAKNGRVTNLPFDCECQKLVHMGESFGYRLNLDGKSVAYCSDTSYCQESIKLAKNSDVLLHECTSLPGVKDGGWGHSNPEEAAQAAKVAGVKKLILTHFMPDAYPTTASRRKAEIAARKIFKNSIAAKDGMSVKI